MSTVTDIGTLITRSPETCGNRPRIAGTRISVQDIAIDYNAGITPEQIAEDIPHLTLAQVYAALTYYHANRDAIEADIAVYYDECERLEAEYMAGKF